MKITVEAEPKEIAAVLSAVAQRKDSPSKEFMDQVLGGLADRFEKVSSRIISREYDHAGEAVPDKPTLIIELNDGFGSRPTQEELKNYAQPTAKITGCALKQKMASFRLKTNGYDF